jgi:hypothetical protein
MNLKKIYKLRNTCRLCDKKNLSLVINLKNTLNSKLYGLDNVKERILEFYCAMINNPFYKKKFIALVGPPGVGKSYGVEQVLSKHDMFADVAQDSSLKRYEIVKGAMSALGLYKKLYEYADKKSIVVFDDCDSILLDDISLNILKAALDSGNKRTISWNTDSKSLRAEGVPNMFEFKGGCIFITNIKFDNVRSKKLKDHLEALESRCHYLDLTIDTEREKILRIKQIVNDGMLDKYNFNTDQIQELLEFVNVNKKKMRELSLRMVLKISDLMKSMPNNWQQVATITCMRGLK